MTLCADGSATVDLSGMRVARHDLLGRISLYPDEPPTVWRCEDAMWGKPLPPHVVRAAENAARRQVAKARRAARGILRQQTARPKKEG